MKRPQPDMTTAEAYCASIPDWARAEISTTRERFGLIMGVLETFRPVVMAEIGVSAGILSGALLHKASQYAESPKLYGVDLGRTCYYDEDRPIGVGLREARPELSPLFDLRLGKTAADLDGIVEGKLDFAYIDANHCHPWASIDMLCLLPHMRDGGIIGLHDTNPARIDSHANAAVYTFHSLNAEKFSDVEYDVLGSGFCVYRPDAAFLQSLLDSFLIPWETDVPDAVLEAVIRTVDRLGGDAGRFGELVRFVRGNSPFLLDLEDRSKERVIARYENSTSWRATSWLRGLVRLCRR
ncbi:class I SAM-dependent methyltransferase [Pseudodesulfovibrio sp.]|uniref:class I SAM-dependent methyltransferase n=1 Tax=Pseudodesulfovibrio sp. TaxID=2035812 RepID=UPI0026360B02|nr:class I SAM-dependent methyltransferase [Pseudodesulfovibrio sp.]MDD3312784.1 class I SAM-dependent methyltransferase [Pseudodesulfovibrio sp.]